MSPTEDFEPWDAQAQRILATLVSAPFPGRAEIARQIPFARGRPLDDHGCLALSAIGGPSAIVVQRIPVEAEVEDADGMTIHVLLHVVDGYMTDLEIFREDGGGLRAPLQIDDLRVIVYDSLQRVTFPHAD